MEDQISQRNVPVEIPQSEILSQVSPPLSASQFTPPAPKKNILNLLIIVLIIAVIGMGGIVWYLQKNTNTPSQALSKVTPTEIPSPTTAVVVDETANWKTYSNSTYNYSISFPKEFMVTNLAAGSDNAPAVPESTHLFIHKEGEVENYIKRILEIQYIGMGSLSDKKTASTVAGLKAFKVTTDEESLFDVYQINIPDTDSFLEFYVAKNGFDKELIDQILSTFKFTDSPITY